MFCKSCRKEKTGEAFSKGFKQCDACYDNFKEYYATNKERYQANRRAKAAAKRPPKPVKEETPKVSVHDALVAKGETTAVCRKCDYEMSIYEFRVIVCHGERLAPTCNDCHAKAKKYYEEKTKPYKIANAERIKEQRRDYLAENKEKVREREKAYWERNRERLNAMVAAYNRNNLHVRMKQRISARIRENIKKLKSTKEYLGCGGDVQVLLKWLEHQFDDKMSWDNYGEYWQIDHVLPVKKFNLENQDEVHICFSWMNVQPLERLTNTSKHNRIIPEMVDAYIERLRSYGETANCQDEITSYLDKYIPLYNKLKALKN